MICIFHMGRGLATAFAPRLERPTAIPGQESRLRLVIFLGLSELLPPFILCVLFYIKRILSYIGTR